MFPSPHGPSDGRRITVTDDNPTKLYTLTQTLRDAGHCVFAAYDGQSALELVVQLPNIDLLITNTRLGLIDGPELMRLTRQRRPDLPILHVAHDGGRACTDPGWGPHPDRAIQPERAAARCPSFVGLKPRWWRWITHGSADCGRSSRRYILACRRESGGRPRSCSTV